MNYKNITIEEADIMWELGVPVEFRCIGGDDTWDWSRYGGVDKKPSDDIRVYREAFGGTGVFEYRVEVE